MTIATGTADIGPPPRKRGRPVTTGTTPQRTIRVGQIWDDCAAQAATDGQTMAYFVRDAIARELDRRRNLAAMARDHAGHGLPCTPCGGPCTIDAPALTGAVTRMSELPDNMNFSEQPGKQTLAQVTFASDPFDPAQIYRPAPCPAHPDDCVCGHDGCQGETARTRGHTAACRARVDGLCECGAYMDLAGPMAELHAQQPSCDELGYHVTSCVHLAEAGQFSEGPSDTPAFTDAQHFGVLCDDRPYCKIPQHHALEDVEADQ